MSAGPASPPGTSSGSRFRKSKNHANPTPSQNKRARRNFKVWIQQNIHQQDDAKRGFVKGQPTGNCNAMIALDKDEDFETIEIAINSSRLSEELKHAYAQRDRQRCVPVSAATAPRGARGR